MIYLVLKNLQNVDDELEEYLDNAVLNTDSYNIYDDVIELDCVEEHCTVEHSEEYVDGDTHVNTCENRHSFLRNWIRRFRGVSKKYLQGYLDFFALTLNHKDWMNEMLGTFSPT